jgi:hypothetical protein
MRCNKASSGSTFDDGGQSHAALRGCIDAAPAAADVTSPSLGLQPIARRRFDDYRCSRSGSFRAALSPMTRRDQNGVKEHSPLRWIDQTNNY